MGSEWNRRVAREGREGHWGLTGMRERAKNIGAPFELWSEAGAGTEIESSSVRRLLTGTAGSPAKRERRTMNRVPSSRSEPIIRILVVDDHPLLRDGITALIADEPDMEVLQKLPTGARASNDSRAHRPDITLMDLRCPGHGLEAISPSVASRPRHASLFLPRIRAMCRRCAPCRRGSRLHPEEPLTPRFARYYPRRPRGPKMDVSRDRGGCGGPLDGRCVDTAEVEVLRLISQGCGNKEIAARLSVTEHSVKSRVKSVLAKLEANDRTHAAMIGLKRGIIDSSKSGP